MLLTINNDPIYFTQINETEVVAYHVHDSTDEWFTVINKVDFWLDEYYSDAFMHCLQINRYKDGDPLAFMAKLAETNEYAKVCLVYYLEHIYATDKFLDDTEAYTARIDKRTGDLYKLLRSEALEQEIDYIEVHGGSTLKYDPFYENTPEDVPYHNGWGIYGGDINLTTSLIERIGL